MNLNRLIQIITVYSLFSPAVLALSLPVPVENRAVSITVSSIGVAVDSAVIRTARQVIGHALANGVVDNFTVYSPKAGSPLPVEGGFSACADAGYNVGKTGFGQFISDLKSIKPKTGTVFLVKPITSCNADPVICTADVKLCPDGSYVSRTPPSCAFAACP